MKLIITFHSILDMQIQTGPGSTQTDRQRQTESIAARTFIPSFEQLLVELPEVGSMDSLQQVSAVLHLKPDVVEKAQDLVRLMHLKLQAGSLRKAERCRHVLAIDLAAQVSNDPCKREDLLPHAGLSDKDYSQALMIVRNNLGIKVNENVIQSLSIVCGCESIGEIASDILKQYRENYVSKLDLHHRKNIRLDDNKYQAAAFLLAAKLKRISIDKKRVVEASGVLSGVFHQLYDSIVKNTGNEASNPLPIPVVNKRMKALKNAGKKEEFLDKENQLNSSSCSSSSGGIGNVDRKGMQRIAREQSKNILDKSNFRCSIDDLNGQTSRQPERDSSRSSDSNSYPSSSSSSNVGIVDSLHNQVPDRYVDRSVDRNAGLSSRQLETLRAVQEHSREEELMEEKKRKAESDKFEKFKEHMKKKQMMLKQQQG